MKPMAWFLGAALLLLGAVAPAATGYRVVAVKEAISPNPIDVAWDGRTLYYADPTNGNLYAMDPVTWTGEAHWLGYGIHGVAHDGHDLWVMNTDLGRLLRVATSDYTIKNAYAIPGSAAADLAYGDGVVWVAESGSHTLFKVDPANGGIVGSVVMPDGMTLHGLEYLNGRLYGIDVGNDALVILDAADLDTTIASYPAPSANCHGMGLVRLLGQPLMAVTDKVNKKFYFIRFPEM